jgi:hypothetical protein
MGIRVPKSASALASPAIADLRGDARSEPPADLIEEQPNGRSNGVRLLIACRYNLLEAYSGKMQMCVHPWAQQSYTRMVCSILQLDGGCPTNPGSPYLVVARSATTTSRPAKPKF